MTDSGDLVKWKGICTAEAELKLAALNAKAALGAATSRWHSHPFIEWGMVMEGACRWQVETESYDLGENELIMVPQGAVHRERIAAGSRARLSWVGFVSEPEDDTQAQRLEAVTVLDGSPVALRADYAHSHRLPGSGAPLAEGKQRAGGLKPLKLSLGRWATEIRRLFITLYDEQSEPAFGSEARIKLCLSELLLLAMRVMSIAQAGEQAGDAGHGKLGIPLRQVQLAHAASRFFDNNIEQKITIESVARYFRLTPQYFSTLFRKVHGVSPVQYQQSARVRQACRLLAGSQHSIKEIAALCGYADSAHFCRQFKAHENCSPTRYRLRAP